jgi:pimeloyl-ACP methyl ester carboxylesterase
MIKRSSAMFLDSMMCASMNLLQMRHRLTGDSLEHMTRYVGECERMTIRDYYAAPQSVDLGDDSQKGSHITWSSPITTPFPANNVARANLFPCSKGWSAPTVLILHSLLSASDIGYRRLALRFNELGWNACFVHLPYHYSRVPRGYWNGELAITADLVRNAEGLRQGVIEVRQLVTALRKRGCSRIGILGTSYGGWIGALLSLVEDDLHFVALMSPIVNVEHAIWRCPATRTMRRELVRRKIESALVARHFPLSSPMHNVPLQPDRVLLVAGDFDSISTPNDLQETHRRWRGSEFMRVPQGHFGYRMLRETFARLKASRL